MSEYETMTCAATLRSSHVCTLYVCTVCMCENGVRALAGSGWLAGLFMLKVKTVSSIKLSYNFIEF